jgi:hypothetical protein
MFLCAAFRRPSDFNPVPTNHSLTIRNGPPLAGRFISGR